MKMTSRNRADHDPWQRDLALLHFTNEDAFTIGNSFESVFVLGKTGSGKTSLAQNFARPMLEAGYGFCVLTPKKGEADQWRKYAAETGRTKDLKFFGPSHPETKFNALDYLYKNNSRGTPNSDNLVSAILQMMEVKDRQRGYGGDPFWQDANRQLLGCAIDLIGLAGEIISFPAILQVMNSAPLSAEEVRSETWQKESYLNRLVNQALARQDLSPYEQTDLVVAVTYWLQTFPRMHDKTRDGVMMGVSSICHPFVKNFLAELLGTTSTITPEATFDGAILILDVPVKEYLEAGQFVQILLKTIWQKAVESRDLAKFPRPVCLWVDECHLFLTSYDPIYQSTARSAKACSVFLTQNLDSVRSRYAGPTGEAESESLLGNFSLKLFCAQDHVRTNDAASRMIGERWMTRTGVNTSFTGNGSMGASTQEQRRFLVDPIEFVQLRTGGPENDYEVEAIAFRSGRPFSTELNHMKVCFSQRVFSNSQTQAR